mgnify:CR=1 FL=1
MPLYLLNLPNPEHARGDDAELAFTASSADSFAEQLQDALSSDQLFKRWKAKQADPDAVPDSLGAIDTDAVVSGKQQHLAILLQARTHLPGEILKHRMRLLAGSHWTLNDVR